MYGKRQVTRPLVARKREGSRLHLFLIDAGRTVEVLGAEDAGGLLLHYNGKQLIADAREVQARTVSFASVCVD